MSDEIGKIREKKVSGAETNRENKLFKGPRNRGSLQERRYLQSTASAGHSSTVERGGTTMTWGRGEGGAGLQRCVRSASKWGTQKEGHIQRLETKKNRKKGT